MNLKYPLDIDKILRKKKSIKKELLLKDNLIEKNIAILGGSTTSEIKKAVDNVLEFGKIKNLIICFVPSFTHTSGMKSGQINPKEYYGTLQSDFIIRYYYYKYKTLRKGDKEILRNSYWGYTDNSFVMNDYNSSKEIDREFDIMKSVTYDNYFSIDDTAYVELNEMLEKVRKSNIQILAYYFPFPKRLFETEEFAFKYQLYKNEIDTVLDYQKDVIVDFNQNKYDYIRDNDKNYFNTHHLSEYGAKEIFKFLNKELKNKMINISVIKNIEWTI